MSPQRLAEGFARLRDRLSTRDRSRQKRNLAEQPTSSERSDSQVQQQPQSQQVSSASIHSTATTATASQNVPIQTEAIEEDSQPGEKPSSKSDLWDKALTHLSKSEYDRDIVAIVKTFTGNPIGDNATADGRPSSTKDLAKDISERMAQAIQDGQHSREQREWKVTVGHKEYSARGMVDKTVDILNKFVAVGDVAVSFDPVHAALPWAAVRFVLVTLAAGSELRSQIIFGLAKVTSLILQCDTYRRIYLTLDPTLRPAADILDLLETSIVHSYVNSLLFLGFAIHRQGSRSRMVSAPFKLNEVESYIESLQESGDQLSRAADDCEKQCNLQNRTGVKELLRYAKESHQSMQTHSVLLMDIHQKMVFDKLRTAEGAAYDSHANEHEARCHPQTRVDLLAQIYKWAGDPDSECIYWLQGMAGTGKSTISRTVAYELSRKEALGASFFFKRGEGDRGKAARVFPTIATQLVRRLPSLMPHIQDAIETDSHIGEMAISKQFENLIRLPLTKMLSNPQNPPTVVTSVHLKFFVTSRPEIPVYVEFRRIREPYKDFILHLVDEHTIEHDITAFLNSTLAEIRNEYNMYPLGGQHLPESWPSSTEIHDLVKMAIPLFIFAATACQLIQKGKYGDPEENLNKILERTTGTQISKLNELYLFVLEQLLDDPINSKEEILKRFQEIVGAIVILADPLSVTCLAKLLDISEKKIGHVVGLLPSVLYMPSEKSAPIKPLHLSFRDFLVNRNNHETDPFWVDEKETHKNLAKHCLHVMRSGLRKNICGLSFSGMRRSAVDLEQLEKSMPSQLQYACMHWAYHQTKGDPELSISKEVYGFLTTHFLHWLEAMSLLGRVKECLDALRLLARWVEALEDSSLSTFIADAERFIQAYFSVAAEMPLQIYCCLAFAPRKSIMRRTFEKVIPKWICSLPKVEENWDACLLTLEGHSKRVNSVVFLHDSKKVASGSWDDTIRIWNAETGECERVLEGHSADVNSVVFSHDSKKVASGSIDQTIRIWNAETGECERVLEGHSNSVNSVVFSHDSKKVASGSIDQTIRIWNAETGECERELEGHSADVNSVVFSHDSKKVASGSIDETIRIWDAETGECERELKGHSDMVNSVVFLYDSKKVASGSWDKTIRIWDAETGECERELKGHSDMVNSVVFSHDSKKVASGSWDKTIRIWDAETGECERELKGHSDMVNSVVFSHDSKKVASGSWDKTIRIWDAETGECERVLEGYSGGVYSVVFSHDSKKVASGSIDETIWIWNAETGECERELKGHSDMVRSVVFSHDSKKVASGSWDKTIRIWNAETGECEEIVPLDGSAHILSFATDGRGIVTDRGVFALSGGLQPHAGSAMPWQSSYTPMLACTDSTWVTAAGKDLFWLPPECRNGEVAVSGSTVAIGCRSGRVLVLGISMSEVEQWTDT
ncbi:hypothetical protein FGSG_08955 [Fusarium graminearum PH-1]|uniref:hypothetical protein n=1 Tax=Gibberella zeae (strain ATCC MYA-4620 / CBS 123657 / FGSC 9075 / NRRL 31084 / PH-1) TaxID=229533 RepID=UPI00021F265E|nr:hypothetical protein FGSG_08955 [Fusarium graminearum PH-1]ESU15454.1 hypothetical protein FGSG_08955 [Fusarium graminearum PH-1]|eukprot:XP_011328862.1 hypothetical protein FGSG_08955 [Fusarium graminearum PH-1]